MSRNCEGQLQAERIAYKYLTTAKISEPTETKEEGKKGVRGGKRGYGGRQEKGRSGRRGRWVCESQGGSKEGNEGQVEKWK